MGLVYVSAVKELVRRKRLVFLAMAGALPLLLAVVWRTHWSESLPPIEFFTNIGGLVYLKALVFLVSLFFGVPAIHDEIEGRTITYLFTRPLPRPAVYAGRLLAVATVSGLILAFSLGLCFLIMVVGNFGAFSLDFAQIYTNYFLVVLLAVFAYTAIFALMGTALKRPLIWGVLYIFAWENTISAIPLRLQMWTLEWHLRNLVVSRDDVQKSLTDVVQRLLSVEYDLPAWQSLLIVLGVTVAVTLLGGWIFSRKEYVIN
jgi:ABC-type transport system involved in multi-copper enzyme maturation permease subunit